MPALCVGQRCLQQPNHLDDAQLIGATAGSAVARGGGLGQCSLQQTGGQTQAALPLNLNPPRELLMS
jgi:hypothetical protein